jgi:hypothetical protein
MEVFLSTSGRAAAELYDRRHSFRDRRDDKAAPAEVTPLARRQVAVGYAAGLRLPGGGIDVPHDSCP